MNKIMKIGSGFWQGLLIVDGNFCSGDIKKDKEESVMDKEVTLKGKIDSELKEQAELSYKHF